MSEHDENVIARLNLIRDIQHYVREKLMSEAKVAKGSWLVASEPGVDVQRNAMFGLEVEVGELDDAISNKLHPNEVKREAADVAICAFIAADVYAHQCKDGE